MALGPAVAWFEFDPQKIANLPENAIFNDAGELAVGVAHPKNSAMRNGTVDLQTGSRQGNILQIGDSTPGSPALVLPLYVD